MKHILKLTLFIMLFPAFLQGQQSQIERHREILIQLYPKVDINNLRTEQRNAASAPAFRITKELAPELGYYLITYDNPDEGDQILAYLQNNPSVQMAMFNHRVEFRDSIPNDPLFSQQWDMKKIGLPEVWSTATGGKSANGDEIVIVILDKGFDIKHEDLVENVWVNKGEIPGDSIDNDGNGFIDDINGWNFRNNSNNYTVEPHGTWVAGILGAKGNNGKGLAGVNWNVKIMFLAIEYADEVVSAFNYALKQRELYNSTGGKKGAFVVATNGSFGINKVKCSSQPAWGGMYDPMGTAGILSAAATANENWDVDELGDIPTSCTSEFLIAVTSTDQSDLRVSNAAFGKISVDLGAPGKNTTTTNIQQGYKDDFGGTSSASPHVAGAIGLLYSTPCKDLAALAITQPAAAARLVRDAIYDGVDPVSSLKNKTVTGGRLNVLNSMRYLHGFCIAKPAERSKNSFKEIYLSKKGIVRVYPNPAFDLLLIDYSNSDFSEVRVAIYNTLGQEVHYPGTGKTMQFVAQQIQIDVSDWPNGTYFINLIHPDEKITVKFLKQQ